MRVLFVSSEMVPFAKTGGLGDVIGALPYALQKLGVEVAVILPMYKQIKDNYGDQCEFLSWEMVQMGWRHWYSGLFRMNYKGLPIYFIDNERLFGYDKIYVEYRFDIERFAFFQRAVLSAIGDPMGFYPDMLHLNDWQTGLMPLLLEAHYKAFGYLQNVYTLYSIHNLKYQGLTGKEEIADLGDLPGHYLSESGVMHGGAANFMKTGIVYANRVTTVSPTYAKEVMSDVYGEGLNGILGARSWKLVGILNGINTELYNPATDPYIYRPFNRVNWKKGKQFNKLGLQRDLALKEDPSIPLIIMVSRLVPQKGIDLFLEVAHQILDMPVQVVLLGTGNPDIEGALRDLENTRHDNTRSMIMYDEIWAHKIYAAADLLLIPSRFEPCGLTQMIAMRYGCLPLVRETGGLKDTVHAYNEYDETGNGFSFSAFNSQDMLNVIRYALNVYFNHRPEWDNLCKRAMKEDFSWETSAQKYLNLYEAIVEENTRP